MKKIDLIRENQRLKYLLADRVSEKKITDAIGIVEEYNHLVDEKQEHFYVILLDNAHHITEHILVSKGTLNQSLVHPRDVFSRAIEIKAAAMILLHNHPSGETEPSRQDIEMTKRLVTAGKILGIAVLDHIIIGRGFYSFTDHDTLLELCT
jgi:DNA repair protein RadC